MLLVFVCEASNEAFAVSEADMKCSLQLTIEEKTWGRQRVG